MRRTTYLMLASLLSIGQPLRAAEDFLSFYKEEANVVSASQRPQPASQTPATVYVVTQQDIKDSGALNLWDALRSVPGVDVMSTRTGQGEVSIRGLNRPFNNRVLVLLDGKSVLNGYFDNVNWESLQVQRDEIDRIEVVEGPASAVYGANAVAGVINIITRTPEQLQGGKVSYTAGERSTQQGSIVYGKKQSQLGYKFGGGWRSTNRFENADGLATEAGEFNSLLSYDLSDQSGVSVSGGFTNYNTQSSVGILGPLIDKGLRSYGRADYHNHGTRARTSWDHGRTIQTSVLQGQLDYDNYDAQLDQSVSLPFHNEADFGASYHRNSARSSILPDGAVHQDLWAAFFEDKWQLAERWLLMASGRLDRHPLTPIRFSPRGSLLYTPVPEHVFRVSAGTSFRNPTLIEDYIDTTVTVPNPGAPPLTNPPFTTVQSTILGNRTLSPESMKSLEIAHTGRFERVKTNITGFYYHYRDTIDLNSQQLVGPFPPITSTIPVETRFVNSPNDLRALGGELGAEFFLSASLRLFGNYSYQYIHTDDGSWYPARQYPRHKANTGIRTNHGGLTTSWIVHWVDTTYGAINNSTIGALGPVRAYFLVDAHVGYAFAGRWSGLELGVNAFNLLNHDHYETLPATTSNPGQSGELIRARLSATVSYKF